MAEHRLPTHVRPNRYEPHITAAIDEDTFHGEVTIHAEARDPTTRIELHAQGLTVHEATVRTDGAVVELNIEVDEDAQRMVLETPDPVEGEIRIDLTYEGPINEDMTGLYRSQAGSEVCLVTQCEATHAREIFPCFDEPSFKAEIAWTITTDSEHAVLANGTVDEKQTEGGQTTWTFEPTPEISSYLAAFAIGDFDATGQIRPRGVRMRVWALSGKHELGEHARDRAGQLLAWYEDYFAYPYPYATYDQLAVPSFSFGAMENPGLVVFRQALLLLDEGNAAWSEEKAVDRVVSHEFAHMWFGNLVTMEWWDDLWLNEAFAEWIAHKSVDAIVPDHEIWHEFAHRTDQALATDALDATHAIYHEVETPAEAMEMFDAITYGKGSAVMRMLEAYLGEEAFREGLRDYIDRFAGDNARGEDLWQVLAEASGEPVQGLMETWIRQPGHPRVRVERAGEDQLAISQSRHRSTPDADTDARWPVPLVLAYVDEEGIREHRVLVDQAETTVEIPVEGEVDWLIANRDDVGFYRTELGEDLREQALEHAREFSPREQVALLRDEFALVEAGQRSVEAYLEALDEMATGQAHFALVDAIVDHVRRIDRLLTQHGDEEALDAFRAWISDTFGPAMARLGPTPKPGEDPAKRHRRARVLEAVALIGENKQARGAALEVYDRERENPDGVDPDTGSVAVRVNASTRDAAQVREYLKVYEARRDGDNPPQQAQRYLEALPAFEPAAAVETVLDAIEEDRIPNQSVGPLLERMLAEPHAQYHALAYVDDNLETLHEHVGTAWIARVVEATGPVAPDLVDNVRRLLDEAEDLAPESTKRALERVDQRVEFHERVMDDMAAWWIDRA